MVVLNFNHTSYAAYLKDMATAFGVQYDNSGFLEFHEPVGSGGIRVLNLFNDLQVLLVDVCLNEPFILKREKSDKRHFILHFDDAEIDSPLKFSVDDESLLKSNVRHSAARLTSNIFTNTEEIPPGIHIKSVKIFFNEEWLKLYLELDPNTNLLQKYLMLKTESFDLEKLDAEYVRLMNELWQVDQKSPLWQIYLQNRVSLLLERFFRRLHEKMDFLEGKFQLSEKEINLLIRVEKMLVSDFSATPPTIDEFSKLITMSPTTLKKKFKELYGDSIYAYYQKRRMQKAKELLLSGKYNVNQTAEAIGYNNTSNFILSFKKMFQKLPGDLAKD